MYQGVYTVSFTQDISGVSLGVSVKTFISRNYPFVVV